MNRSQRDPPNTRNCLWTTCASGGDTPALLVDNVCGALWLRVDPLPFLPNDLHKRPSTACGQKRGRPCASSTAAHRRPEPQRSPPCCEGERRGSGRVAAEGSRALALTGLRSSSSASRPRRTRSPRRPGAPSSARRTRRGPRRATPRGPSRSSLRLPRSSAESRDERFFATLGSGTLANIQAAVRLLQPDRLRTPRSPLIERPVQRGRPELPEAQRVAGVHHNCTHCQCHHQFPSLCW